MSYFKIKVPVFGPPLQKQKPPLQKNLLFPSISNYLVNMLQSCSEQELLSLFAKFMHAPMTEAYARRILEAYIPMTGPVHTRGSLVSGGAPGVASRVWALLL